MSLQPTDVSPQTTAMRVAADLLERAFAFGAKTVPVWSFLSTGGVHATFPLIDHITEQEMDAWRLALGVAVSVTGNTYYSKHHNRMVRTETMHAMFAGIKVEILTVRLPVDAVQAVAL